jgi:hypothetical protein
LCAFLFLFSALLPSFERKLKMEKVSYTDFIHRHVQCGSNMTGTNCDLF